MGKYRPKMKPEMVAAFLKEVRLLAGNSETAAINNRPWANGRVNKTQQFMAETGLTSQAVRDVVGELQVKHFSKAMDDHNPRFQDETVWIFGMRKNLVDHEEHLYIKLKIRAVNGRLKPTGREARLEFPFPHYKEPEEAFPSGGSEELQEE